jgi:hypothetical protein
MRSTTISRRAPIRPRLRIPPIRVGLVLLATLALALPGIAQVHPTESLPFLTGKLESVAGTGPVLRAAGKDLPLTARTTYLFHTLQDKRLANRDVRLQGTMKADGTFEVAKLFTVRDGKMFRVRYYCEICNIEALEPGKCICCQQPTELQEAPATDSK